MTTDNGRPEILRFIVLVIIIIVTLVVVAALRPLIFDRIVPAIIGGGQPAPAAIEENEDLGTGGAVDEDESTIEESPAPADESPEAPIETDDSGETIPVQDSAANEENFPTARPGHPPCRPTRRNSRSTRHPLRRLRANDPASQPAPGCESDYGGDDVDYSATVVGIQYAAVRLSAVSTFAALSFSG